MYLYRYLHMCMCMCMCPIGSVFLEKPDLNNSLVEKSQYFCRTKDLVQVPDPSCTNSEELQKILKGQKFSSSFKFLKYNMAIKNNSE